MIYMLFTEIGFKISIIATFTSRDEHSEGHSSVILGEPKKPTEDITALPVVVDAVEVKPPAGFGDSPVKQVAPKPLSVALSDSDERLLASSAGSGTDFELSMDCAVVLRDETSQPSR